MVRRTGPSDHGKKNSQYIGHELRMAGIHKAVVLRRRMIPQWGYYIPMLAQSAHLGRNLRRMSDDKKSPGGV